MTDEQFNKLMRHREADERYCKSERGRERRRRDNEVRQQGYRYWIERGQSTAYARKHAREGFRLLLEELKRSSEAA